MPFLSGCGTWKAVPLDEAALLFEETFSKAGVEVNVAMYSKRSFHITLRNTLANYRLREMPSVLSKTGDLILPAVKENNEVSFNYSPAGSQAVKNEKNDITIQWVLEETGEEAFLIVRKSVLIDIDHKSGRYNVNSVKVLMAGDAE
jgi:hypothetical protein